MSKDCEFQLEGCKGRTVGMLLMRDGSVCCSECFQAFGPHTGRPVAEPWKKPPLVVQPQKRPRTK